MLCLSLSSSFLLFSLASLFSDDDDDDDDGEPYNCTRLCRSFVQLYRYKFSSIY